MSPGRSAEQAGPAWIDWDATRRERKLDTPVDESPYPEVPNQASWYDEATGTPGLVMGKNGRTVWFDPVITRDVALAEDCEDPEVLRRLAANPSWLVRLVVAKRKMTPPDALDQIARLGPAEEIAERTDTPIETLRWLAKHDETRVRMRVASNPSTPADLLDRLARSKDIGVNARARDEQIRRSRPKPHPRSLEEFADPASPIGKAYREHRFAKSDYDRIAAQGGGFWDKRAIRKAEKRLKDATVSLQRVRNENGYE